MLSLSTMDNASGESAAFYRIRALASQEKVMHGDPRESLENALKLLSTYIRDDPTVPCSNTDRSVADENALDEDVAVELPAKHCAFVGCSYRCDSDEGLRHHLQEKVCS